MVKLLIIADDMTGALDSGVQLAARGVSTAVALSSPFEELCAQAAVVDLECRHDSAQEAYKKTFDTVKAAAKAGVEHIYLKTDSTLRGNVGPCMKALRDASGRDTVFAPAYPDAGRVTVGGIQYVGGVDVSKSDFARDPFNPVLTGSVQDISQGAARVADAATNEDLRAIALSAAKESPNVNMAGSAGLAAQLPDAYGLLTCAPVAPALRAPMLLLCGSINPAALAQTEYAQEHGVQTITLSARQALSGGIGALTAARVLVVRSSKDAQSAAQALEYARLLGMDENSAGKAVARTMGQIAADAIASGFDGTLAVFGGDTLFGVLAAIGARALYPRGEILTGTVLFDAQLNGRAVPMLSKAGGFGGRDIICALAEKLV